MDDDLVYKKPRLVSPRIDTEQPLKEGVLPTFEQLQAKQQSKLLEMAQVRYGIKGTKVEITLTMLKIQPDMSEAQVFKLLLTTPEHERADQVLYALAKGDIDATIANQILASLALLSKIKKMPII